MSNQKFRLTGVVYTHQTLWHTAKHFAKVGEEPVGSFYPLLAAGVFAYFAFEALLNEILRQVDPDIWAKEREVFSKGQYRGTLGKFDYLADKFSVSVDRSRRPYQTVRELAEARDELVHARTEMFDVVVKAPSLDSIPRHTSILDIYSSTEFVARTMTDIKQVSDALLNSVKRQAGDIEIGGTGGAFDGVYGSWEASAEQVTSRAPMSNTR
jgi:hypothetical protein